MKKIKLGGALEVSRIGLGRDGHVSRLHRRRQDEAESIRTIHRALDLGVTLIDTAEVYGPYTNEELVAAPSRSSRRGRHRHEVRFDLATPWSAGIDSTPEDIRTRLEGSLQRLDTDYIDLYYQHRVDPECRSKRRRRARRASRRGQDPPHRTVRGQGDHSAALTPSTRSPPCSPSTRSGPATLKTRSAGPARARHRARPVPSARPWLPDRRHPLSRDLAEDDLPHKPTVHRRELRRNMALVREVERSPGERRHPCAGRARVAALKGDDIAPIPGTKRVSRLEENVGADAVELTPTRCSTGRPTRAAGAHHSEDQ